jgi:hypothetical protein
VYGVSWWQTPNQQAMKLQGNILIPDAKLTQYLTYYLVEGPLVGPNGTLAVVTVWSARIMDGVFQFVTLKPKR